MARLCQYLFIVQLPNGSHLLLSHWQSHCSEVFWSLSLSLCEALCKDALCIEPDKVRISPPCFRSSQPAPGAREIPAEANPALPDPGAGPDRVSGEAALRVLRRGVAAQEAGWGCLHPWGHPAVPIEGLPDLSRVVWCTWIAGAAAASLLATCCICCDSIKGHWRQWGGFSPHLRTGTVSLSAERAADLDLLLPLAMTFT